MQRRAVVQLLLLSAISLCGHATETEDENSTEYPCPMIQCVARNDCVGGVFKTDENDCQTCDCNVTCPIGMVWHDCGSACNRTCVEPAPMCTEQCVPRCECPSGHLLHDGECIVAEDCPAQNETVVNCPTPMCSPMKNCIRNELKTDENGCITCECKDTCPDSMIWNYCGSACDRTCEDEPLMCTMQCVEMCECPQGTVLHSGRCITREECPTSSTEQCSGGQIWTECGQSCTPTCDEPIVPCDRMCNQRCECPTDKPLMHDGNCKSLDQCPSPCSIGAPLRNEVNRTLFCGRGPSRVACPDTHVCNIHPADGGAVCCDKVTGGPCHIQLQGTWMGAMIGSFIPTCNDDGTYRALQCHGSTGSCWCVTSEGDEIDGTRSERGEERPTCTECDEEEECPAFCHQELAPNGCPHCNCMQPCNVVDCSPGYTCINRHVQCVTEPCYPQAQCVHQACLLQEERDTDDSCMEGDRNWFLNPTTFECEWQELQYGCEIPNRGFSQEERCTSVCVVGEPVCADVDCELECAQYRVDAEGCDMCECATGCEDIACADERYECVSRVTQCLIAPCPVLAECLLKAEHLVEMCVRPASEDDCGASMRRYFYSLDQHECLSFTYGGCDPMGMGFESREECQQTCVVTDARACPEVRCPMDCATRITEDEDGCSVCNCMPRQCPSLSNCELNCTHGLQFAFDGCEVCECACPRMSCDLECDYGRKTDTDGCEMCDCACSRMMCRMGCRHGFKTNEYGCEICQCNEPCMDVYCEAEEQECVVRETEECYMNSCLHVGECVLMAEAMPQACTLPIASGPCEEYQWMWYYNSAARDCFKFQYGGCEGNGNNFASYEDCMGTCLGEERSVPLPCPASECGERCEEGDMQRWTDEHGCQMCRCQDPCEEHECEDDRFECMPRVAPCLIAPCPVFAECVPKLEYLPDICLEAVDDSDCGDMERRYFYSAEQRECSTYMHGGCGPSNNHFESLESCQSTCNITEAHACDLECDYGYKTDDSGRTICECECSRRMCRMMCRYGFKINEQNCEFCDCNEPCMDAYCEGEEQECIVRETDTCYAYSCLHVGECVTKSEAMPEGCTMPLDSGSCEEYQWMWYYNSAARDCFKFQYGGCEGNGNNFASYDQCMGTCLGEERSVPLPCPASECGERCEDGDMQRWTDEHGCQMCRCQDPCEEHECEDDRFECVPRVAPCLIAPCPVFAECVPKLEYLPDICLEAVDDSDCGETERRYFYSAEQRECSTYMHGGCEPSSNHFESLESCQSTCNVTEAHACDLECDYGYKTDDSGRTLCECECSRRMCRMMCRYGFKINEQNCEFCDCNEPCMDVYCEGEEQECIVRETDTCYAYSCLHVGECVTKSEAMPEGCTMPLDSGSCDEYQWMWYYNSAARDCFKFQYGGCEGNGNNFASYDQCMGTCLGEERSVPLPCPASECGERCEDGDMQRWTDEHGCQMCRCQDPCEEHECEDDRFECVPRVAPCLIAPCPVFAECVPKLEYLPDLCLEAVDESDCGETERRYFYSTEQRECSTYMHGCEPSNNHFESLESCQSTCNVTEAHACDLECDYGYKTDDSGRTLCECECSRRMCRMMCRYGFKINEQNCEFCDCNEPCMDVYCEGEEQECIVRETDTCYDYSCLHVGECVTKSEAMPEGCTMPLDSGSCEEYQWMWYYNSAARDCFKFQYGGCEGNGNNFASYEDCMGICLGEERSVPLPCPASECGERCEDGDMQRWTDEHGCQMCRCQDPCEDVDCSDERFECVPRVAPCLIAPCPMFGECVPKLEYLPDLCLQAVDTSICGELDTRYHFSAEQRTCTTYMHGGCQPTLNHFHSLEECQATCNVTESVSCDLECDYGYKTDDNGQDLCECACSRMMCRMFCQHGFKTNEHGCEICECNEPCMDVYCEAEEQECFVRETEECYEYSCRHVGECVPRTEALTEVCNLPIHSGSCQEYQWMWYYNSAARDCFKFQYGGCEGNGNNFASYEDCMGTCLGWERSEPVACPQSEACQADCEGRLDRRRDDRGCQICRCYQTCEELSCDPGLHCMQQEWPSEEDPMTQVQGPPSCVPLGIDPVCTMPMDKGPCEAALNRYFYDVTTNECTRFKYGGCDGNANRFMRREDCERKCSVTLCPSERDNCAVRDCRHGYMRHPTQDCDVCACAGRPCLECSTECGYGYEKDAHGCDRCDRCYDPCTEVDCGLEQQCLTINRTCDYDWCTAPRLANPFCVAKLKNAECGKSPVGYMNEAYIVENGSCSFWTYDPIQLECELFTANHCDLNMDNRFASQAECEAVCRCPPLQYEGDFCVFGHRVDDNGCQLPECMYDPCIVTTCMQGHMCAHVTKTPDCQDECVMVAKCMPMEVDREELVCDWRQEALFADICTETCSTFGAERCPGHTKCCPTTCGGHACMPAVSPHFEPMRDACAESQQAAVHTLRVDPSMPMHVPFCAGRGLWQPVQCNLHTGMCWCADPRTGHKLPGTMMRGTPRCHEARAPNARDAAVCSRGAAMSCSPLLCMLAYCPARPDAQCRVMPCGDCSVMWFDGDRRLRPEECFSGASQCHMDASSKLRSFKSALQYNMVHANNTRAEFMHHYMALHRSMHDQVMATHEDFALDIDRPERPDGRPMDRPGDKADEPGSDIPRDPDDPRPERPPGRPMDVPPGMNPPGQDQSGHMPPHGSDSQSSEDSNDRTMGQQDEPDVPQRSEGRDMEMPPGMNPPQGSDGQATDGSGHPPVPPMDLGDPHAPERSGGRDMDMPPGMNPPQGSGGEPTDGSGHPPGPPMDPPGEPERSDGRDMDMPPGINPPQGSGGETASGSDDQPMDELVCDIAVAAMCLSQFQQALEAANMDQSLRPEFCESLEARLEGAESCSRDAVAGCQPQIQEDVFVQLPYVRLAALSVCSVPEIYSFNDERGAEGGNVTLRCSSHAAPTPTMAIRKLGYPYDFVAGTYESGHIVVEQTEGELSMTFVGLKPEDASAYTCIATNVMGHAMKNASLIVEYSPRMVTWLQRDFYGWPGKTRNVTCLVDSEPQSHIDWLYNERPVENNDTYRVIPFTNGSVLQVYPREEDSSWIYGTYTCRARNAHGESSTLLYFHRAFVPDTPEASIIEDTPTSVTFQVLLTARTNNLPTTGYRVAFDEVVFDFGIDEEVTVTALLPNSRYVFKISARNEVGPSIPTEIAHTTMNASEPHAVEIVSATYGWHAFEYTLQWHVPNTGGAPIEEYQISHRPVMVDEGSLTIETVLEDYIDNYVDDDPAMPLNSYMLMGLVPAQAYEVQVFARNRIGWSMTSDQFVFLTALAAPVTTELPTPLPISFPISSFPDNPLPMAPPPTGLEHMGYLPMYVPQCRPMYDDFHAGYHFKQCDHTHCWCVDHRGQPRATTVRSKDSLLQCTATGLDVMRTFPQDLLPCADGSQPLPCTNACANVNGLAAMLGGLNCSADPCNDCREALWDQRGRLVDMTSMDMWVYDCEDPEGEECLWHINDGIDLDCSHPDNANKLPCTEAARSECRNGGGAMECADACSESRCAGFPEAQCTVDPCTCQAVYMDVVTNNIIDCNDRVGVCHRYNYAIQRSMMRPNGSVPGSDMMLMTCDEAGAFRAAQCHQTTCWCVMPNGQEVPNTRLPIESRQDLDCDRSEGSRVNLIFTFANSITDVTGPEGIEPFMGFFKHQLANRLSIPAEWVQINEVRAGSIIVDASINLPANPQPSVIDEILELQQTPANETLFEMANGDDSRTALTTKEKVTVDFVAPVVETLEDSTTMRSDHSETPVPSTVGPSTSESTVVSSTTVPSSTDYAAMPTKSEEDDDDDGDDAVLIAALVLLGVFVLFMIALICWKVICCKKKKDKYISEAGGHKNGYSNGIYGKDSGHKGSISYA